MSKSEFAVSIYVIYKRDYRRRRLNDIIMDKIFSEVKINSLCIDFERIKFPTIKSSQKYCNLTKETEIQETDFNCIL